jgi:RNA polymerase sigma-70 factor, ECF subfamily
VLTNRQAVALFRSSVMDELTRLAHAARLGDRRALDALVRVSYPEVWRLCSTLVDESTADDLAQESVLRATRSLPGFRSESSARTWILAIARRTCMDELRSRHRRRARDEKIASGTQGPVEADFGSGVLLRELLAALDQDQRAAFVLTQLLSCSYGQAASVCDCPVGTIRSRVARARANLIAAMGAPLRRDPQSRPRTRAPGSPDQLQHGRSLG